jgi:hypothetical protein
VTACCDAASQFLFPVLIFKGVNQKEDFDVGLPPGSEVHMNPKLSYTGTGLFTKRFAEHFLKHRASGNVIVIQTATEFSAVALYSFAKPFENSHDRLSTEALYSCLQFLDEYIWGPSNLYLKKAEYV